MNNHRRAIRRQCKLPFEIRTKTSSFPIKGETSDVSPYGCYIQLLYTLPKDTAVEMVLWLESTALRTTAKVVTSDPSIGNGIEFVDMPEDTRAQIKAYLETLEAPESESGPIFR